VFVPRFGDAPPEASTAGARDVIRAAPIAPSVGKSDYAMISRVISGVSIALTMGLITRYVPRWRPSDESSQ